MTVEATAAELAAAKESLAQAAVEKENAVARARRSVATELTRKSEALGQAQEQVEAAVGELASANDERDAAVSELALANEARDELARALSEAERLGSEVAKPESGVVEELRERMCERLVFGTAGLRGLMGAGFNRMNHLTVVQATQGLWAHLRDTCPDAADRYGWDSTA